MSRFRPLLNIWENKCLLPDQDGKLRHMRAKISLDLEYISTEWNNF